MKIFKKRKFIFIIGGLAFITFVILVGSFKKDTKIQEETTFDEWNTSLPSDTINSEAFKELFPNQYNSYRKTSTEKETFINGSKKESKFIESKEPLLPILFKGYGFSLDYNEDRGHAYALEDISSTLRINQQSPGACLTCKSSAVPELINQHGKGYYNMNFKEETLPEAEKMGHSAVGCSDCHNPATMSLRVTRPHFIDAMAEQGIDVNQASREDMKNYVCGQCHTEYYFRTEAVGEENVVTLPLKTGYTAKEQNVYYAQNMMIFPMDYMDEISGAPMLKAQHPDFETYMEGPHSGKATCVDCHMSKETDKDGNGYTSHYMTSPMNNIEGTCLTCHKLQTKKGMERKIKGIQSKTMDKLHEAQELSAYSHYYVNRMIQLGIDENEIATAQIFIRHSQWYWDFVAAENSTGFHNPKGQMDDLKTSIRLSKNVIKSTRKALKENGVDLKALDKEIEQTIADVLQEPDSTKKRDKATNDKFPSLLEQ